jgi:hypothetical protein
LIAYIWDKKSINVSFVKDIFSITLGIVAPYAAIILFTDWKKQSEYDKALTLLIEVSSAFSKMHRSLLRLKLNREFTDLKVYYLNNDFLNIAVQKRLEFNSEVDKLTEIYDELDHSLKSLYLITERQDRPFKLISDEYFKITYKLKDIYILYLGKLTEGHKNKEDYDQISKDRDFKLEYLKLRYVFDEKGFIGEEPIPEFLSTSYIKSLKDDIEQLILDFKKTL